MAMCSTVHNGVCATQRASSEAIIFICMDDEAVASILATAMEAFLGKEHTAVRVMRSVGTEIRVAGQVDFKALIASIAQNTTSLLNVCNWICNAEKGMVSFGVTCVHRALICTSTCFADKTLR